MLSLDREMLLIVGIVVCIAATAYMYKEFTKAKTDIDGIKNFCNKLVQAQTPPPPPQQVRKLIVQEEDQEEPEPVNADTEEN